MQRVQRLHTRQKGYLGVHHNRRHRNLHQLR